jgi:hypothetical protein
MVRTVLLTAGLVVAGLMAVGGLTAADFARALRQLVLR